MNPSRFMDKQIMGLSGSQTGCVGGGDFFELMDPQEDHRKINGGEMKDDIIPGYDFQQIRPSSVGGGGGRGGASSSSAFAHHSPILEAPMARGWGLEMEPGLSNYGGYGSLDYESAKVIQAKDKEAYDAAIMAEIDQTMKKYTDNLLHALEGVSARLTQLESRTHHLEDSVDDLKASVTNDHENTDGKLRQLENVLREVQTCMQVLREKQEIAESHLQLAKIQSSKENQPRYEIPTHAPQSHPIPPLQHQPLPPPQSIVPQSAVVPPPFPLPNAPPSSPQKNPPPQRNSYYPPPGQALDPTHQQYQIPTHQQQPLPPPHQQYPPTPPPHIPQYSQPIQQPPPPKETNTPYLPPPQTYPPQSTHSPSQQFYGRPPSHMYEPLASRTSSGPPTMPYPPTSGPGYSDSYPFSVPHSHYSDSGLPVMKPPPGSGGGRYPQLPTAHVLPQAMPTVSSVGSSGKDNKVPIDDIVDKVVTMGFSREQVRGTVRRLTENGQSVDLNVVLDKLMNER
ncbi:hypothetical protein QJS04_geneDACA002765 [Acorus gramineus]|uniref:DUF1421 domain-containing protein n=1 Tax=Acorus gramineus TaxID=55184 RepID=A0AAV9BVN9_ACOGR|nr:hypothetical protein QJS04_geneDACA002765 [Acorus gramineus]